MSSGTSKYHMTTCGICVGKISRPWLSVICAKCQHESCRDCFQSFLMNSPLAASCMNCRGTLSDDFIMKNTSGYWRSNNYKDYRETLLFEIEKARLPETQGAAAAYRGARIQIKAMRGLLREEKRHAYKLYKSPEEHKEELREVTGRIREQQRIMADLERTLLHWGDLSKVDAPTAVFIRGCPATGCRGFLNESYRCGLCDCGFCGECLEPLDAIHMCDQAVAASVATINREAKPCPSCATLISKIDGCDQMWCTQCHTTFSWITGRKEAGITHNPHYYEWMRSSGRVIPRTEGGNGPCEIPLVSRVLGAFGQEVWDSIRTLTPTALRNAGQNKTLNRRQQILCAMVWIHRQVVHVEHVVNQGLDYVEPDNLDLRVRYLIGEISTGMMMKQVQKRDKAYRKNLSKHQIYTMTYSVATDLFGRFVENTTLPSGNKVLGELVALLTYSNDCLETTDKMYGSKSAVYRLPLLAD